MKVSFVEYGGIQGADCRLRNSSEIFRSDNTNYGRSGIIESTRSSERMNFDREGDISSTQRSNEDGMNVDVQ